MRSFLFNDGEEYGLSGSTAFVQEHAWARNVGVVFDFDSDSPNGASTLGWTTAGDSWLQDEIARADTGMLATPDDVASKRTQHNNDLHVFAAAGFTGVHLDTVGGSTYYHNQRDSLANLDSVALQQQGDAMLALVHHFGNLPLAGLAMLLATVTASLGWCRGRLGLRRLAAAIAALISLALVGGVLDHLGWQMILVTHPESQVFRDADFYAQFW